MVNIHGGEGGKAMGGGGGDGERGFFLKLPVITAPETLTVEISLPFPSWGKFNLSKKINWLPLCFFLEPVWKGPRKLDNERLRVHSDGFHSVSFIVTYCGKKPSLTIILYFTSSFEERDRRGDTGSFIIALDSKSITPVILTVFHQSLEFFAVDL